MPIDKLEAEFNTAMMSIYTRAKAEAGYNASIFHRMLNDLGGLATAKRLVNDRYVSDGYTALWERGRLDLTVEAIIYDNPKWHSLFTLEEMGKIKKRLTDYRYI